MFNPVTKLGALVKTMASNTASQDFDEALDCAEGKLTRLQPKPEHRKREFVNAYNECLSELGVTA